MKLKLLYLLNTLIITVSCNYNPYSIDNDKNIIIKYNKNTLEQFQSKGVLTNNEIIAINNDSVNLSPDILLLVDTTFNIIADRESKIIYCFDSDFRFKYIIGKSGMGSEEFPSITSINIDKNKNIHIFSKDNFTETIYDIEGKFITQNNISYEFSSAYSNSIDYFYYLSHINVYFNDRVLITDNNGALIGKYFPEDYKLPVVEEMFPVFIKSPASNAVYIRKTMTNKIYKFSGDTMFCAYSFDFGEYSIPQSYYNTEDGYGAVEKAITKNFATLVRFIKGNNVAVLAAAIQKPQGPLATYAINNNGKWKWINYPFPQNINNPLAGSLQGISVNDELIFILNKAQLEQLINDKSFSISNKNNFEKEKESNIYILKSKLK